MKTFVHANQNKFAWIHLVANNGIYDIYKKDKSFYKGAHMLWYHPALLSFDNHATLSAFILLTEFIQYFNTYNTHLIAKGDVKNLMKPTWKSLEEVYKKAHTDEGKMIPHNDILILSHPHYPIKYQFAFTLPGNAVTVKKEMDSKWIQDKIEEMDAEVSKV